MTNTQSSHAVSLKSKIRTICILYELIIHVYFRYTSSQVSNSATCVDIKWKEMLCLTGPRGYLLIKHKYKYTTIDI